MPADEPAGALDPATGTDVMAPLAGPDGDGTTLIVTAHDPETARRIVALPSTNASEPRVAPARSRSA